jgi:hypothetical protein
MSLGSVSLLGRSINCDLVIDHPSVSRKHALLSFDEGGMRITDLGSKNGTFVDDIRVTGTVVTSFGSRIRIGYLDFLTTGYGNGKTRPDSFRDTEDLSLSGQTRIGGVEFKQLSEAQLRVFRLLVDGLSEKHIVARLKISRCTVHNHIGAIYRVFGVHSRAELPVCVLSGKVRI